MLGAGLAHPPQDRLGDDVPGRQVGELVLAPHEPGAVVVDEHRALAADRLADQRLLPGGAAAQPQHGGVELHELQVARPPRRPAAPAPRRPRSTPAGWWWRRRPGRCRRWRARTPGPGRRPPRRRWPSPMTCSVTAAAPPVAGRQQVEHQGVLDHLDAGVASTAATSARSISAPVASPPAWAIRSAWWPPSRVSASSPVADAVEPGAELDQLADRLRPLVHQHPDRLDVAQPDAGDQGVAQVRLGGVVRAERGGDAALRPPGRAGRQHVLGDHQHPQPGRRAPAAIRSAVVSPAMPEPTTTTSVSTIQPGAGASSRCGRLIGAAHRTVAQRLPSSTATLSISRAEPTRAATSNRAGPAAGPVRAPGRAAPGSPAARPRRRPAPGRGGEHRLGGPGGVPAGPQRGTERPGARRARPARAARCGSTAPARPAPARSAPPTTPTARPRSRTSRRMSVSCW